MTKLLHHISWHSTYALPKIRDGLWALKMAEYMVPQWLAIVWGCIPQHGREKWLWVTALSTCEFSHWLTVLSVWWSVHKSHRACIPPAEVSRFHQVLHIPLQGCRWYSQPSWWWVQEVGNRDRQGGTQGEKSECELRWNWQGYKRRKTRMREGRKAIRFKPFGAVASNTSTLQYS